MTEYIDRETVKEIMQKYRCSDCASEKSLDCPLCQLHRPFAEISKIPTADVVEVRHGRWEKCKECCCEYRCSVCGYEFCRTTNYCPNCGAKMDGERGIDTNKR